MSDRNNKGNSLVKNASLNIIKQLFTLAFSLITFPYVSRVLGDVSYGKYSFATSIIEYMLIFSASAGGAYAIREGAQLKGDNEKLTKFASEIFSIGCIFTCVAYVVLFLLTVIWSKAYQYKDLLFILSFRLSATLIGVEWVFHIFEDFKNITIRQIVVQGVGLLLTLLLVHSENDAKLYAVATVVAMSGANLVNFFVSRKYIKIGITKSLNWKKHIKPILMILFYSAMISIYSNADIVMLGVMKNNSVVGIYSVATKIYGIAKNIFIAALTVLLPRMSAYLGENRIAEIKKTICNTMILLLIGLVPAIVLLAYYAETVILIVAGKDFLQGTESLQLLSIALLFAIVSSLLTTNIMLPNRQENKITILVTVSAVSNVILNVLLIPMWGTSAAALTTVIAEIIVCVGAIAYSKEYLETRKILIMGWKICLSISVMLIILFLISALKINDYIEVFVGSCIACLGYCLNLSLLNVKVLRKCCSKLRKSTE